MIRFVQRLWRWWRNRRNSSASLAVPVPVFRRPLEDAHESGPSGGDRIESRRVVTINGEPLIGAGGGSVALVGADGSVREHENLAYIVLADGTLVDRFTSGTLACCQGCALSAGAGGTLTTAQIVAASLHRLELLERSTRSGVLLCPRHRITIPTPDGVTVLSHAEADALQREQRLRQPLVLMQRLFREIVGGG